MSQFVTQERRLITLLPWLGARENILGQKARLWLQYSVSFERIKALLQNSDGPQQFTLSSHALHHPQFNELISLLTPYKKQITLQISQSDFCEKADLLFSLSELGFEIELIVYEPASIETQITLAKAANIKIKLKILTLISQHYSVQDLFESLYLTPQTPITLFFSNTTSSEDWLHLSPSQSVIRSEEAYDCLNRLGQQDVKISTFNPSISKETEHEENPFLKNFTSPSASIWTLSAIGSLLALFGQFLLVQAANILQVIFSKDLTQTRMYWDIKNRLIATRSGFSHLNRSTALATKRSATQVRHSTFMFFNPIYWNLYSLVAKITGHSRFYSTIMYWKSFRIVQLILYIFKQALLPLKYAAEFIFYSLRHVGFTIWNRAYWMLYRVFANIYGLTVRTGVFFYWQVIVRITNLIYRPLNHLYWSLYGPALTLRCSAVHFIHLIQRPFKNLYWFINNAAHVIFYKALSLVHFVHRNLIRVYWCFYSPTLNLYSRATYIIQRPFKFIYWRLYGLTIDLYYAAIRFAHMVVRIALFLAWPLRKAYWFSRFQYYKRIRKQAYEN